MTSGPVGVEGQRTITLTVLWLTHLGIRDGLNGGVAPEHITPLVPWAEATVQNHCRKLTEKGVLVKVQGVARDHTGGDTRRARPSFLPADHPDAPGDETPDGPPRTLAEVRRADD